MNKKELVKAIQERQGDSALNQAAIETLVDSLTQVITDELYRKGKITLVGFGSFSTVKRKPRTGVNPKTGKPIKIPAKTVPVFKAGKELKERVNK